MQMLLRLIPVVVRVLLITFLISLALVVAITSFEAYVTVLQSYGQTGSDTLNIIDTLLTPLYPLVPVATYLGVLAGVLYSIFARSLPLPTRLMVAAGSMLILFLGLILMNDKMATLLGMNQVGGTDAALEQRLLKDREKVRYITQQIDNCNVSSITVEGGDIRFSYNSEVPEQYHKDSEGKPGEYDQRRPRLQGYLAQVNKAESRCGGMTIDGGGDYVIYDIGR